MLRCDGCGCVSEEAPGWVGLLLDDPDDPDETFTALVCPPCAAERLGFEARVAYT